MLGSKDKKDLFAAVGIAVGVSVFFYLFYGNTGFIRSEFDVLVYYFGCMVPFGLPVCVLLDMFHKKKRGVI